MEKTTNSENSQQPINPSSDFGSRFIALALIHILIGAFFLAASFDHSGQVFTSYINGITYVLPLWFWGGYSAAVGVLMLLFYAEENVPMMAVTALLGLFSAVTWSINYLILLGHNTTGLPILATPWLWLWYTFSHFTLARVLIRHGATTEE